MGVRLTKSVREALLKLNEGFSISTSYTGKNFRESRSYLIRGGELIIRSVGKTSWADSRFDKEWVADAKEVHQFLYKFLGSLNTDGLD